MDLLRQATLELMLSEPLRHACLQTITHSGLPQAMVCAGFVRNAIWDDRFGVQTEGTDVDVAYFDPDDLSPARDAAAEAWLPVRWQVRWQVRNQARMHRFSDVAPYVSAADAVSRFPEMATCLAAQGGLACQWIWGWRMPGRESCAPICVAPMRRIRLRSDWWKRTGY